MKISSAITLAVVALANEVSAAITVTGATTGLSSGSVPQRRNIVDLFNDGGPAWTLYVKALSAMMDAEDTDPESYFQLSGIHGRPVVAWDSDDTAKTQMGYCPHAENLFLPWHRPYLALFEQVLVEHAIRIAEDYSDPAFTTAAESLRLPYWDWAEDATVPPFAGDEELTVLGADGPETITNPLFSYQFPQAAVDGDYGRIILGDRDTTKTIRCTPSEANDRLAEIDLKGMVYNAFTRSNTFEKVGSMGSSGAVVSFEQPHNSVHMRAGCGSHFAYTQEGAFDPLFMLHHANVDRLWAMWEELYPQEKVLNPAYDSQGTFAISPGTKIDGESPLLPFFGPGKSDFTSANVIDCETFGYTYPELSSSGSSEDRRRQMASIVNRMYGPDSDDGGRDVVTPSIPGPTAPASTGGRLPGSAVPTGSASMPESIISLSSAAPESTNDVSSDLGRLPGTDLPADDSISVPASVPTSGASATETADGVTGGVSGGLTGIPSATLTAQPTGTGTPDDDFQLFPELPDINTTIPDISNPFPEDLIPDLPDLGIDIGDGLEYVCKIKIAAGNLPTPSEMNVYVGGKQAGSFAVLSTPHDGYVAGEFSLRKVLGVLGLLKGLISDLVSGKIRNPVDVIKDNIHVEFIHPDGKVITHKLVETDYELVIEDLDFSPSKRPDELPTFGKSRQTKVKAKPAPERPGKCLSKRATPGDLPGVSLV